MDADKYKNVWFAVILIFILLLVSYSNSFHCTWQLDDYDNITLNPNIHVTHLDFTSIKNACFAYPNRSGVLYRPVVCLTFALNWYLGADNVVGYHIVNFVTHLLTAIGLFFAIQLMLICPNVSFLKLDTKSIYFVSLLATVLWAVNPIQTQAVTYIVQRMAQMAAMFYIYAIFFFLKARLAHEITKRVWWVCLCGLFFILGMLSKQNTIMLPMSLLLIEVIFFQDLSALQNRNHIAILGVITLVLVFLLGYLIIGGKFASIITGYEYRTFTLWQRVLTEFRVVLYYLFQIFFPNPARLSIDHSIVISTSLLSPLTTLLSILAILALIGFGFSQIKKQPVLAFAILFFFVNHATESSFYPLELIFEHRNYLPSLFLFVPAAMIIDRGLRRYRLQKRYMFIIILGFTTGVMTLWGYYTFDRNKDWYSTRSLWLDAMKKAPDSRRPLHNLAWGYYEKIGDWDTALNLYRASLKLKKKSTMDDARTYNNMAGIYLDMKNYNMAKIFYKKAIDSCLGYKDAYYGLIISLLHLKKFDEAMDYIDFMISKYPDNALYYHHKGLILLKWNQYAEALHYFQKSIRLSPYKWDSLTCLGITFNRLGFFDQAVWFLKYARTFNPDNLIIPLWLADTYYKMGLIDSTDKSLAQFITQVKTLRVDRLLDELSQNNLAVIPNVQDLIPGIIKQMNRQKIEIDTSCQKILQRFGSPNTEFKPAVETP